MTEFTNSLNHYLKSYLGENNDDYDNERSDEIKLFDTIQSLPRHEHQTNKLFV